MFIICLLVISAWTRRLQTAISLLFNIINKHFLHIVSSQTHTVLLVSLATFLSKSVSEIVDERRWQFSMLCWSSIIIESLGSMEKWSSFSLILLLPEQIVGIVGDLLVERLMHWEPITLRKSVHLFRS